MDCSPSGFSVHGISQARILEWVALSSSRGSSQPRDQTCITCPGGRFFTAIDRHLVYGPCTERISFINLFIGSASLLDSITLPGYYPDSNSHYPNHFVHLFTCFFDTHSRHVTYASWETGLSRSLSESQGLWRVLGIVLMLNNCLSEWTFQIDLLAIKWDYM